MSGAIHLVAALVVIVGIPFLGYLHQQMHQELVRQRVVSPPMPPALALAARADPRPDPRITAAEGRIAFLESEREFYAKKWETYDATLRTLIAENERLQSEIQKFPVHVIDPPQNRLTMWRSE